MKPAPADVSEEPLLSPVSPDAAEAPARTNKANVLLLLLAAMFYDIAVGGAVEILGVFVVKEPLSWTAAQVTPLSPTGFPLAPRCALVV